MLLAVDLIISCSFVEASSSKCDWENKIEWYTKFSKIAGKLA